MNRLKTISVIWGIVAVLLFAFLTTLGFVYKNKTQKYKKLENKLVEVTKKYTSSDFKYPSKNDEIIVTFETLKEKGLIEKLEVDKQKCDGYVVVSFDGVTKYKAYIKCDKYKTHDFNEKNLNS